MNTTLNDHIIICSTSFHESDRRLIRISESLQKEGYKITWISRSYNKQQLTHKSTITHLILSTWFSKGPFFYLEYNLRIFFHLFKFSKVTICAVDLDTIPGAYLASKVRSSTIVHDAHEIYYEVPELSNRKFKKGIWKSVAKFFLPKIKYNYTVNNSLSDYYSSTYNTTYDIIRNIGPKPENISTPKKFNKVIAYLGVLNEGRGLEIAINAMKIKDDYKLIILGEGDRSQELRAQANGMSNVEFLGLIQPNDIFPILAKADIGLNILSANSLNYKLSLANKFFDYLHAGLPSINMRYPEYEHILSKHHVGLMVDNYSVDALIKGLENISRPEIYNNLKVNCRLYRDLYDWKIEEEKLIIFYRNLP